MKSIKLLSVLALGTLILTACGDSSDKETPKSSDTAKQEQTEKSETKGENEIFKDNTLTTKDAIVTYTGSEKGTDYDGKPIIYTFFTVTNKKEEPILAQALIMNYVEFNQNLGSTTKRLDFGITIDSPHQDKLDILQQDINPDGTVDIAYVNNIEDESKPVSIIFKENMFDSKPAGTIEVDVK